MTRKPILVAYFVYPASMIKSIKLKLWLTLFATLVFSLGVMLSLSYISVKQRFLAYANSQILERLELLEVAVIEEYNNSNALASFIDNPARWSQLRDATYRQYVRDQNRRKLNVTTPQQQDWSERESIDKKLQPNQRAFFQHLILVQKNKSLIAGRLKEGAVYAFRELRVDNKIIAYIGYIEPKAFLRSVDKLFVDQQVKSFGYLSIFMLVATLLVTIVMSRWLVAPLSLLAKSAKRVAEGDFSVRVGFNGDDELGTLCQDFDEMAQSLEKNEVIRKQWVADISHEMRTPLSVLKAQIEAMEDGIRKATPENFSLLRRNIDSLSGVVDDLYEVSLADLGELRLDKTSLDLRQLFQTVLNEFDEKFKNKKFTIINELPDYAIKINADGKRIKQLLSNLLENSYRYTDEGGQIRCQIHQGEKKVDLIVEDSAPAVPADSMPHIFDRLYRIESSRNRETGGAGLGLSICSGIVDAHAGRILASHSSLGGLKQTVELPYGKGL